MQSDNNSFNQIPKKTPCFDWTSISINTNSNKKKFGILLVSHGSLSAQGRSSIKAFQTKLEKYFNIPVRLAFTSIHIRNRLAKANKKSDSVVKALQKMSFEKFTHVAVQSLHHIPGLEYIDVLRDVNNVKKITTLKIKTGYPLLLNDEDVNELAKTLLTLIPNGFGNEDRLLWMGHGTPHRSDKYYQKLATAVNNLDQRLHVAYMEGDNNINSILKAWENIKNIKQVWLLPLLSTIGRHALHDMAGDSPDSWKNILQSSGYHCIPHIYGLAENELVQNIWINRICNAMQRF